MNRIAVFCGSRFGSRPAYREAAERLGRALVRRDIGLVYGGASVGLMGAIADCVLAEGGEVIGVIPVSLRDHEIAHKKLHELHVVDTMRARKAMIDELSDGFIALPGGIGTLEELAEALTLGILNYHGKPCGVLNVTGYFNRFLVTLDGMVEEGFFLQKNRNVLIVEETPENLLDRLLAHTPPP